MPAEDGQSPLLPEEIDDFLNKVWSLVPAVTPATSQPSPGSFSLQSPIQSICSKSFSLPYTKQKPSSPLLKYVWVWLHSAKIVSSEEGWQITYTSPGFIIAPASNVFQ